MSAGLTKDKLIFNSADIADSDAAGSYLLDSTGALLTSQTNGSQRALDVGINVAGVQIDPRAIRALTSSDVVTARNQDGAGNALTSQVSGSQRALDVGINVAGVAVDPRAIRALTATDVVTARAQDGAGTALTSTLVSGKQGLDVNVISPLSITANTAVLSTDTSIASTATKVVTTPLTSRKTVLVQNNATTPIYLGASGVTTANGFIVHGGSTFSVDLGPAVDLYGIVTTGTNDARILEIA